MADLYKAAGVNIDAGNETVKRIKNLVRLTYNQNVLGDLGNFGGLYSFPKEEFNQPILVSSTDGVGTKLKVAFALQQYGTVGEDLVNHCVDDILVQGAKPLFFLDYFGTGRLEPAVAEAVVAGFSRGCLTNNCVLIGGETAEMPGIYAPGEFDLAGTIVGVVERDKLITGEQIQLGDIVLGLPSTGLHTNGYSLARQICFEKLGLTPTAYFDELQNTIGLELLTPHRSYFKEVYPLVEDKLIKGMAHITGGGFYDNIPRILPEGCQVKITLGTWPVLPIFNFLQKAGSISDAEIYRVFNMGIGMVLICEEAAAEQIKERVTECYEIGRVVAGEKKVVINNKA